MFLWFIICILVVIGTAIYQFKKCDDWMDVTLTSIGLIGFGLLFFIFYKSVMFIYTNGCCL